METNPTTDTNAQNQFVVFTLRNEEFGIHILKVREIIRIVAITSLPDMAVFMEGIINLRGEVIPVIDLRKRFGIQSEIDEEKNRILLVEFKQTTVGFIVDAVQEVLRIEDDALTTYESGMGGGQAYIEQIGRIDERLLIIVNLEKVLSTEEKIALSDISDEIA